MIFQGKCNEDRRIDFSSENHRNHYKTLYFMLQYQYVGGKTLKTTNKLAGPVGKEGVLDGINRW